MSSPATSRRCGALSNLRSQPSAARDHPVPFSHVPVPPLPCVHLPTYQHLPQACSVLPGHHFPQQEEWRHGSFPALVSAHRHIYNRSQRNSSPAQSVLMLSKP